jgi:hypothetical protein
MEMVDHVRRRLAGAFAVLFGPRGAVTREARDQGRSRQALYREAATVVAVVESSPADGRLAAAEARLAQQAARIAELEARLGAAVEVGPDRQAAFAATAQAEGVSLPVARRLLAVLIGPRAPSVAALGRASAEAAGKAGRLLGVLDAAARPRVEQAAADEIFSAKRRS